MWSLKSQLRGIKALTFFSRRLHKLGGEMLLRGLFLLSIAMLCICAEACPSAISKGIDNSGTDYYNAKEAACLPKVREVLKTSIFAITSNKPDIAWHIADALLCRKGQESRDLVSQHIVNPLKESAFAIGEADQVRRRHRKASDLMEKGCAFSPKAERLSDSSIKVSYHPYQSQAYCGNTFVLEYRKSDWYVVEVRGGCS